MSTFDMSKYNASLSKVEFQEYVRLTDKKFKDLESKIAKLEKNITKLEKDIVTLDSNTSKKTSPVKEKAEK